MLLHNHLFSSSFGISSDHAQRVAFGKKYFFDTEFNEFGDPDDPEKKGANIDLISIGIVCEDGREFYAVNRNFDPKHANHFVRQHILPKLGEEDPRLSIPEIREGIEELTKDDPTPQFYAYTNGVDWFLFTRIFGHIGQLPDKYPRWCHELRQEAEHLGIKRFPKVEEKNKHSALDDAKRAKRDWEYLQNIVKKTREDTLFRLKSLFASNSDNTPVS